MKKTHFQKALSLVSSFSLLINSFFPVLSYSLTAMPAYADKPEEITTSISFDAGTNSFTLSAATKKALDYALTYKTPEKTDGVLGHVEKSDTNFQKTVYAGTCSALGTECTPHEVVRGFYKVEVGSPTWLGAKRFTISNGQLTLDKDYTPTQLSLTDDENYWLENGTEPTITPTPTPTPTTEIINSSSILSVNTSIASIAAPITNSCVRELYGSGSLTCTANDVRIARVIGNPTILDDGCAFPGDTVQFQATYEVVSGAQRRYDIGLYFSTDGDPDGNGALGGACTIDALPYSPVPPAFNYDNDQCGDIEASNTVNHTMIVTATCLDTDSDGYLNVPYCTTWDNNSNTICTNPLETVPGAPSKCNCDTGFQVPVPVPFWAKIEIVKDVIPDTDLGTFNLELDNVVKKQCASDGESSGILNVSAGSNSNPGATYTVGESECAGTDLTDYNSSISCVKRGTAIVVASGSDIGPLDVPVQKDDDIVCTVTNQVKQGNLIVKKVVINDNGGTKGYSDFSFQVNNGTVTPFETDGQNEFSLIPGQYNITEPSVSGYSTTYDNCDVAVTGGTTQTCTITNDDQAGTLIVKKVVVNNNGGTKTASDFSFTVNSGAVVPFEADGQNDLSVSAGTYNIAEPAVTGYTTTYDNCSNMVVVNGGTQTCTVTNNDNAPALHLRKTITNDNGGTALTTAWTLTAIGTLGSPTNLSGSTPVDSGVAFKADTYTLGETGPSGYSASSWNCTGDVTNTGNTITLSLGQSATCTINNNDIAPTLKLVKVVTNDNGGNVSPHSWTLYATGLGGFSDFGDSSIFHNVEAGEGYTLTESTVGGYAAGTWSCNGGSLVNGIVTLNLAQNITCTITNDDIAPKLTLVKTVINDNGGNAVVSDFPLFVNSSPVTSGTKNTLSANTIYTVSETTKTGYAASTWGGDCAVNGTITLLPGDDKTCTIANDDIAPKLTLVKSVINNNGGNAVVSDFPLYINGNLVISGVANTLSANMLYTATETNLNGYTASSWGGDCAANGTITLLPGDDKTCTITNNDVQPKLTLVKTVVNNFGGTLDVADFPLFVDQTSVNSGIANDFDAGTYTASETQQYGYSASVWGGDCATNGSVTLSVGYNKTCTITNTDIQPKLTVTKVVVNDNGGLKDVSDFPLFVDQTSVISGIQNGFNAGNHTASETPQTGYSASGWVGDCSADGSVTLNVGDVKACAITNDDLPASITLIKHVDNNYGGTSIASDFILKIDNILVNSGDKTYLNSNQSYTLDETIITGYQFVNISGDTKCPSVLGGSVTLDEGEDITCTITNEDIQPKLTVTKVVVNDNGGLKDVSDFPLFVDQTSVISGIQNGFNAGRYAVSETQQSGYQSVISGDCASDGSVTLAVGDVKSCTITNDDQAGTLIVKKEVINDNGGKKTASDFTFSIDGGTAIAFESDGQNDFTVNAGTYNVVEPSVTGYSTSYNNCSDMVVPNGGSQTCTVTNDDISPSLTITKYLDPITDPGLFNLLIDGNIAGTGTNVGDTGTTGIVPVNAGYHTISESAGTNTDLNDYSMVIGGECADNGSITLDLAESKSCTITNTLKRSRVIVTKFNDLNKDGIWDQNEPVLPDWTISLNNVLQNTNTNGQAEYLNLLPDTYTLSETIQSGWAQSNINCLGDEGQHNTNNYQLRVTAGTTYNCTIGNYYQLPALSIEKYNDKEGIDITPGTIVKYTLEITAHDNLVNGIFVKDTLPKGFDFDAGSVKVTRNGIDITGSISIPSYNTFALWNLGDLAKDETIKIEYNVKANGDPGLYKDVAWTYGSDGQGGQVLGIAGTRGMLDTNFVGTAVNLVGDLQSNSDYKVDRTEIVKRQVLGASTFLPATGANTLWLIIAGIFIFLGTALLAGGFMTKKTKKKIAKTFGSLFATLIFVLVLAGSAQAADLNIRLSEPKSPTYKASFNIDYVVLDLQSRNLTVKCFKKVPGEASFNQFGSDQIITGGGTSGICNTGDSPLGTQGTYEFKATVTATGGSAESNTISLEFKSTGPGTPTNYSKTKDGCHYTIKFRTADDGNKTVRAEIYMSENKTFNIDPGSRVRTVSVGSNTDVSETIDVSDCGKEYWFAVRAYDSAGNGSDVVGDTNTTTNYEDEIINPTPGVAETGAIAVSGTGTGTGTGTGGEVLGEKETTQKGKVLGKDSKEKKGEVKSATEKAGEAVNKITNNGKNNLPLFLGGAVILAIIIFLYRKFRQ